MRALATVALLAAGASRAHAEAPAGPPGPCDESIVDPVITPVRAAGIDGQRTACLRDEALVVLHTDALIDTPGFRGVLGSELRAIGRMRLGAHAELDVAVRALRGVYVQNAVTKVTAAQFGPLALGGAWGTSLGDEQPVQLALAGSLELPYTRQEVDTLHTSGDLAVLATTALTARTTLHARLGLVWMYASSLGGRAAWAAPRAGVDLARRVGRHLAVQAGADVQAGWYGAGLDHVNLRAGVHARLRGAWRLMAGLGVPVGGDERTNAVFDLGVLRDLR